MKLRATVAPMLVNGCMAGPGLVTLAWLEIQAVTGGYLLLLYDDRDRCIADEWYESLALAKEVAHERYAAAPDRWAAVSELPGGPSGDAGRPRS